MPNQNAIVLHTNSYDTFDHFAKSLRLALKVIGDAAKPALVQGPRVAPRLGAASRFACS